MITVYLIALACVVNTTTYEAEDCKIIKPGKGVEVPADMPMEDACQALGTGAVAYRRSQPDLQNHEIVFTRCYNEKGESI